MPEKLEQEQKAAPKGGARSDSSETRIESRPDISGREKEPKISYHFFYSSHRTVHDLKNLEKALKKADIYAPEVYAWTPKWKFMVDKLSQGETKPEQSAKKYDIEKSSSYYREFEVIYNSHKPILMIDIPEGNKDFIKMRNDSIAVREKAVDFFKQGKFQNYLQAVRSYVIKEANLEHIREKKIRGNLEKQLKIFLKQNPEYANKKEIKILVKLGQTHTSIYHKLKKDKIPASREFSHFPPTFISLDEAIRRIIFKREVDDELLARAIIEVYIFPWLNSVTNNTNKSQRVLRKISSQLTLKDVEQISKNIAEASQEPQTPSFLGFPIEDVIYEVEKLGIKVPNSEQEIDELLKKSSTRTSYGNPKS